jgi:enoyl-CoA hydratase/carnithine racemase
MTADSELCGLRIHREGRVQVLTLDRPQAKNAMDSAMIAGMINALERAGGDEGVGAVLITAEGAVFCPGADLKEIARISAAGEASLREAANQRMVLFQAARNCPKPVIAAINGTAIGGGCGLAMSCDIVIASDAATFSYPEVKLGVVPGTIMVGLMRSAGEKAALDLILTGRRISAAEALQYGLVSRVVPHASLMGEAMACAQGIAGSSAAALRHAKALFHEISELDRERALQRALEVNLAMRHKD